MPVAEQAAPRPSVEIGGGVAPTVAVEACRPAVVPVAVASERAQLDAAASADQAAAKAGAADTTGEEAAVASDPPQVEASASTTKSGSFASKVSSMTKQDSVRKLLTKATPSTVSKFSGQASMARFGIKTPVGSAPAETLASEGPAATPTGTIGAPPQPWLLKAQARSGLQAMPEGVSKPLG